MSAIVRIDYWANHLKQPQGPCYLHLFKTDSRLSQVSIELEFQSGFGTQ